MNELISKDIRLNRPSSKLHSSLALDLLDYVRDMYGVISRDGALNGNFSKLRLVIRGISMKKVCQLDVNNLPLSLLADVEVRIVLLPQAIVLALSLCFEGNFLMRLRGKERLTHDRGKVILACFHRFGLGHLVSCSNSCEWL